MQLNERIASGVQMSTRGFTNHQNSKSSTYSITWSIKCTTSITAKMVDYCTSGQLGRRSN